MYTNSKLNLCIRVIIHSTLCNARILSRNNFDILIVIYSYSVCKISVLFYETVRFIALLTSVLH